MEKYLLIGLGGGFGSILRYLVSRAVYHAVGETFPYGTLAVNIIGCLIIGLLMALMQERLAVNTNYRFLLVIGLLGGFTTFSSFSYETFELIRSGSISAAMFNVLYNVAGCLVATWSGYTIGKNII
ncbi:MAG: fluoride efflux transporter CrcB [Bacteroidota bacterium]